MAADERVVIVTGAAGGIGAAVCRSAIDEGFTPLGVDLREGEFVNVVADLGDQAAFDDGVGRAVAARRSSIVGLVNAAGLGFQEDFLESTDESWDRVLDANLMSTVRMCRLVIPGMLKATGDRSIVNFGSQAGKSGGIVIGAHYSAAKAAVMCLTKSLAAIYGPEGIRVNAVAPGIVETAFLDQVPTMREMGPRIPLRRLGTPDDVAGAVLFLLSDRARYITGEIVDINGGLLMD
jgi:NAD(P)-dependent dehydrogenase (short-subunit alcohol dehydrogenase family)